MKNWIKLCLFVVPLVAVLMFVNYSVDPAGVIKQGIDTSEAMALIILKGEKAYHTSNFDERSVKAALIKNLPEKVYAIAVGPSLVMCVNSEIVGTDSFYNLGESGADFYDIMAQFGMLDFYGKQFNRVIFCIDSYFFDEGIYGKNTRNGKYQLYATYMMNVLENKKTRIPTVDSKNVYWTKFTQLFSLTYFQTAVRQIFSKKNNNEGACYCEDASWIYPLEFQNKGIDFVKSEIKNYDINKSYTKKGSHPSEKSKKIFELLINYLQEKDVIVSFFLCPCAPSLQDKIAPNDYPLINELEEYVNELAEKYGIKLTGSYNPHNLKMSDSDFYDARHVRRERLGNFFDFSE